MNRLQSQVDSSSKELLELRHQHGRLRKTHAEKCQELQHWRRKAEAADKEVRQLRGRIDELKGELGRAQDSNDEGQNACRYHIISHQIMYRVQTQY